MEKLETVQCSCTFGSRLITGSLIIKKMKKKVQIVLSLYFNKPFMYWLLLMWNKAVFPKSTCSFNTEYVKEMNSNQRAHAKKRESRLIGSRMRHE